MSKEARVTSSQRKDEKQRGREGGGEGGREEERKKQIDVVRKGNPELSIGTSPIHSSSAGPRVHLPVSYTINFLVTASVLG